MSLHQYDNCFHKRSNFKLSVLLFRVLTIPLYQTVTITYEINKI